MAQQKILLFALPAAVLVYIAIAAPYPYYATWDSSQVFTLDALIAGAGQLPDHFFHPNAIPLVLYRLLLPIGELLGCISVSSIEELQSLSNPYLAFAETTRYLIAVGAVFAFVFLAFMCSTLFELLEPCAKSLRGRSARFLALTAAALALTWKSFPFMLIWVRHETIGLSLWSIALYSTVRAARAPQRGAWVLLAGFFSGAAMLCKMQLIGGVLALPFLYVFLSNGSPALPSPKKRLVLVALAFGVFAFLSALHLWTYSSFVRGELPRVAFDKYLKAGQFAPIAPACALLLALATAAAAKWASLRPELAAHALRLPPFAAAFCAPLLFMPLIGTTWSERAGALHFTYIYSFMLGQLGMGEATGYIKPIVWSDHIAPIAAFAAALAAAAIGWARRRERLSRARFIAGLAAVTVTVLAIALLLRPSPRKDGMMHDAWILLAALVVWRMLLALFSEKRMLLVGCAAAWLCVGYHIHGLAGFHERNYVAGEYSLVKWKEFNYGFRGKAYRNLMRKAYPTDAVWMEAFDWSLDLGGLKLLLTQSFPDTDVEPGKTMLAVANGRFGDRGAETLSSVDAQLDGAILIPLSHGLSRVAPRADLDFFLVTDEAPEKLDGKVRSVPLSFESRTGGRAKKYLVYSLAPGVVSIDTGDAGSAIAVKRRSRSR